MPALTSLGIGSGVDLNSMLTQLVSLERRPIAALQTAATKLQTKVSAFGKMQSLLADVQSAANALNSATLWKQSTATSANDGIVSAVGGSTAAEGSYAVTVGRLASAQTLATTALFGSADELVGGGTLTLAQGSWDDPPTQFSPKSGSTPVAITIAATDTLANVRDRINAAGAGVTASIVTDSTGTRLSLRSSTTGEANGFKVTATDDDGNPADNNGLSRLAFDPENGVSSMDYASPGADAEATVNGVPIKSATNELSKVVDGLVLRLRGESATPVDVDVAPDREAIAEAVKKFASAYSALASYIGEQTKYDPGTKVGGALQGDSAVGNILLKMRGVINGVNANTGAFSRLSDMGLELQRDGTMTVNAGKLDAAMGDLAKLKTSLTLDDPVDANDGFMRRFNALATDLLGTDGAVTLRTEGLRKLIKKNGDDQDALERRVQEYQDRLTRQFTAMDTNLSRLTALNNYVTAQLAAMTQSNNG